MPGPGLRGSLGTISITMSVVDRASKRINSIAGNLDEMQGGLADAAGKARTVGSAMTAMGALFIEASNQMAEMMEPMETALARASAMAAGTETNFEDLEEAAFNVGNTLTMSSAKAAKAMYWVASAGVHEMENIKAVAEATGKLSKIHGEMWPEAARTALSAAKIFGVELTNIEEITSVMNKTIASSLMNLHDLGNTMKYAGPVAKTMGWNFESLSSAIASMANMGVRGSKAGTTIRAMLTRLAKPTEDAIDVMDRLGVEFFHLPHESEEAKRAMQMWEKRLDSTQSELKETKRAIERMREAQEELSLQEQKLRLRTQRIRLEAHKENRDMTQAEIDQIDELETRQEELAYQGDVLAYQEAKAAQRKDELKEKQSKANEKIDEARQKYKDHLGGLKSFDKIVAELAVSMKDFGKKQKAAYLKTLFGRRAVSGLMAVLSRTEETMESISVDTMSFGDAVEALTTQKGAAISEASELYRKLSDERKAVQKGNEALMVSDNMYQRVSNSMSIFSAHAKVTNRQLANTRGQMGKMNSSFVTAIMTAGQAKSTFFGFLTGLLTALNNIHPALVGFLSMMVVLGPTISTVGVTLMMLTARLGAATIAQWALNIATSAFPWLAMIGGLIALVMWMKDLDNVILGLIATLGLAAAAWKMYTAAATTSLMAQAGLTETATWLSFAHAAANLFESLSFMGIPGWLIAGGLITAGIATIASILDKAAKGGLVARTGPVEVHKGEVIRPAGWKEETTPSIENLSITPPVKGTTGEPTTDVGGINIEVNTGDIKGIEDVEEIGDTIGERVRDSISRSRKM